MRRSRLDPLGLSVHYHLMRGGLTQVIGDLLSIFGIQLPPWGGLVMALIVAVVFIPFFVRSHRASLSRKKLKLSGFENRDKRIRMEGEAVDMVRDNPDALIALAEEGMRLGRYPFVRKVLALLPEEKKKYGKIVKQLTQKMEPREDLTPDSAVIAIERLQSEGMAEAAEVRLGRALLRWPNDPQLLALQKSFSENATTPSVESSAEGQGPSSRLN